MHVYIHSIKSITGVEIHLSEHSGSEKKTESATRLQNMDLKHWMKGKKILQTCNMKESKFTSEALRVWEVWCILDLESRDKLDKSVS